MRRFWSSVAPIGTTPTQRRNFLNVQVDAIGVGLASAASPFLPVFLTRLGATNFQIGLLTSMPALTGLFCAILIGRFLQTQRQIVPWFSAARLLVILSYAATGLVGFFVPGKAMVPAILLIWAVATIPQVVVNVSFSVVMNAVAGPNHRYELMSRRWSVLGLTTAISVAVVGQILDRIGFPINYQLVFLGLSVGGLISYYFSSHIDLPDQEMVITTPGRSVRQQLKEYKQLVLSQKSFVRFAIQRFVFLTGTQLAVPLFPLYFVRELNATDAWIGFINTSQTFVLVIGYSLWSLSSRKRGSRFVLLWTTLGLALYPALTALTHEVMWIAVFAGLAGIFQAGVDLVFFDELMKTVPVEYSAIFVSLAQSLQHCSSVLAPLIGTLLAGEIGLGGALLVSAGLRFSGFLLFALWTGKEEPKSVMEVVAPVTELLPEIEEE